MTDNFKPDLSCVPYRRKGLYFALTIPFLLILLVLFVYLWSVNISLALIFASFFGLMCYFQAYCCVYERCPYVGGFCPAVIGIMPASWIAKWLYGNMEFTPSRRKYEIHVNLGIASWVALVLFPLYWLDQPGIGYAIGYFACHAVYALIFGLTICPVCAIRDICPGGKFQSLVFKNRD
ncbi:MAG: hypothetical protein U9R58_01635 [Chloroflexota bacterium]|nr:hypothetical protein [Chloroflexota bacterium]